MQLSDKTTQEISCKTIIVIRRKVFSEDADSLLRYAVHRFPWESAFTGREVTQPCCPEVAEFEQHVTGCIAFAARQYVAVTRDEDWLKV